MLKKTIAILLNIICLSFWTWIFITEGISTIGNWEILMILLIFSTHILSILVLSLSEGGNNSWITFLSKKIRQNKFIKGKYIISILVIVIVIIISGFLIIRNAVERECIKECEYSETDDAWAIIEGCLIHRFETQEQCIDFCLKSRISL